MMKEKRKFQPLKSGEVCLILDLLYKRGLVSFPLTNEAEHKIESLVESINSSYFGADGYVATEEKAVAYLYFIIKDHAFTDGNKRVACLAFEVLCDLNNITPDYGKFRLDELAVFIESYNSKNHQELIASVAKLLFGRERT